MELGHRLGDGEADQAGRRGVVGAAREARQDGVGPGRGRGARDRRQAGELRGARVGPAVVGERRRDPFEARTPRAGDPDDVRRGGEGGAAVSPAGVDHVHRRGGLHDREAGHRGRGVVIDAPKERRQHRVRAGLVGHTGHRRDAGELRGAGVGPGVVAQHRGDALERRGRRRVDPGDHPRHGRGGRVGRAVERAAGVGDGNRRGRLAP